MNQFFSSLEKTGIRQLGLSITYTDGEVSVSVLPKSHADDKGLKSLRPLSLRANVEEMDRIWWHASDCLFRLSYRQLSVHVGFVNLKIGTVNPIKV